MASAQHCNPIPYGSQRKLSKEEGNVVRILESSMAQM